MGIEEFLLSSNTMNFQDAVFFITGAAQGLGKAYAEAVLQNGAKVYITDVKNEVLSETARGFQEQFGAEKVHFRAFDVTDKGAFESAFQDAVSTFGQVDVMVNNAGIMNEAIWELMILINYNAVIYGTKLAQEHMRKDKGGKGGRVINISSISGLRDTISLPIYAGTKHAVRSFTSGLAMAPNVAETGIQYGILCPFPVGTDLIKKSDETTMNFYKETIDVINSIQVPLTEVVAGFLDLLQLPNLNGAILCVGEGKRQYKRMQAIDVDPPLA